MLGIDGKTYCSYNSNCSKLKLKKKSNSEVMEDYLKYFKGFSIREIICFSNTVNT